MKSIYVSNLSSKLSSALSSSLSSKLSSNLSSKLSSNLSSKLSSNLSKVFVSGFVALSLTACSHKSANQQKDALLDNMHGSSLLSSEVFYGEPMTEEQEQALMQQHTIHFALDSYEVNDKARNVVFAHARKLLKNPVLTLRLDGHTDERGSRGYNIALGEHRAKAVKQLLMLKGVSEDRISIVSYGKERPIVTGHSEAQWSENRRVEFHYAG